MVFLHSGGGMASDWSRVFRAMGPGFHCLAIDLYGYGKTQALSDSRSPVKIDDHAHLILELARLKGGPVHVVGHSFGGAVALRGAILWPREFATLTLIEPQALPLLEETRDPLFDRVVAFREQFDSVVLNDGDASAMRLFVDHYSGEGFFDGLPGSASQILTELAGVVAGSWSALMQNPIPVASLEHLDVPTVVVQGSETLPPERRMCEILLCELPFVQAAVVEGAGHMSPMTHPRQVAAAITRHLHAAPPNPRT